MIAHENLFEIRNFCWNHTKLKANELPFFNNITLNIPANKIISLHGESGCGKTTLLQLLGCLWENKSISGSIKYYGEKEINFEKISKHTILSLRSCDFGFILQNNFFIPHFNSYWNIGLPLLLKGVKEKVAMEQAKVSVNRYFPALSEDAKKISSELSQGMRQRFSCLRGIITNPRVLFADEPISNLDDHNSKALFASL